METAETADTATDPETIPPAVFKNGREVKKSKNILAILFLHILHMANFTKLALIATEI